MSTRIKDSQPVTDACGDQGSRPVHAAVDTTTEQPSSAGDSTLLRLQDLRVQLVRQGVDLSLRSLQVWADLGRQRGVPALDSSASALYDVFEKLLATQREVVTSSSPPTVTLRADISLPLLPSRLLLPSVTAWPARRTPVGPDGETRPVADTGSRANRNAWWDGVSRSIAGRIASLYDAAVACNPSHRRNHTCGNGPVPNGSGSGLVSTADSERISPLAGPITPARHPRSVELSAQ